MQHDHDDLIARTALPVQHIDQLLLPPRLIAVAWVDLSERPDWQKLAQGHQPESGGLAECEWHTSDLHAADAHIYLRLVASRRHQTLVLDFPLKALHHHLVSIAQHHWLWLVPGPRPDAMMAKYADNHLMLEAKIIARRGPGIMAQFHQVLTDHLEQMVRTWREGQGEPQEEPLEQQFVTALCRAAYDADPRKTHPDLSFDQVDAAERAHYQKWVSAVMGALIRFSSEHPDWEPSTYSLFERS